MRISDWSSDVCSSDLRQPCLHQPFAGAAQRRGVWPGHCAAVPEAHVPDRTLADTAVAADEQHVVEAPAPRSEEHTSELQSLMRISYAVFCLKKKNRQTNNEKTSRSHITQS